MKFSIIIPCKEDSDYLRECIKNIKKMNFKNHEVIVIPNKKIYLKGVKVIPLSAGPAEKRDLGAEKARGEYLAFIDDDAYPHKYWLKNALKYLKGKVVALGGPQITPESDSLLQKASGQVLSSRLVGGLRARYESLSKSFFIDDWPTVNFIIKRSVFLKLGGFDTHYYPGEDTKLCLDLINSGYRISYAPDCIVYHHRRFLFKPHIKQISNYGLHRGFFVKKFPKTSFKITYFAPSLLVIGLFLGLILSFFSSTFLAIYLLALASYFLICFLASLNTKNLKLTFLTTLGIITTHLFYGINFIRGLLVGGLLR